MDQPLSPESRPPRTLLHESSYARIWWANGSYLHYRARECREIRDEQMGQFVQVVEGYMNEGVVAPCPPLLIDRSYSYSTTFEARNRFARWAKGRISAIAYYTPNSMTRMAADLAQTQFQFEGLSRLRIKQFDDIEKAVTWLGSVHEEAPTQQIERQFRARG